MKLRFESDANFKQNVNINKTLIASQIQEPLSYNKKQLRIDDIEQVEDLGGDQSRISWKITLVLYIKPINPLTADDILNVWIVDQNGKEWEKIDPISDFIKTGDLSYEFWFNTDPETPTQEGTYTASILYQYDEETHSYSDKISLYGENGVLRDIQNRLENLKSNFESIGFKYKASNEFSSSIETLTVKNATVDDVILPKEVYDGEKTKLSEILVDIQNRLFGTVSGSVIRAQVNFNDLSISETKEVGQVYRYGKIIFGFIKGADSLDESQGNKVYSLSNFSIDNTEFLPGPKENINISWIGHASSNGRHFTMLEFKIIEKDKKINITFTNTDLKAFEANLINNLTHAVYFWYEI